MHQQAVTPRPAALRATRWPALALALLLGALAPRVAAAQATEAGRICHELVNDFARTCDEASNLLYEIGCYLTAAAGTLICILVDVIVLLGESVGLPSPM